MRASMTMRASLALVALAGLSMLVGASAARAAAFGELGRVGEFGSGLQQFTWPSDLAVDPTDNSVYVLDEPDATRPGPGPSSFRVQKFNSSLGAPVAGVSIPTPEETAGQHLRSIFGIAVDSDSTWHRLYVLEGIQTSGNSYTASEIVAYSTRQEGSALPLDSRVPSGVVYTFPAATAANALEQPVGMAVDPTTHDLIVIGGREMTIMQRIHMSSPESTGSLANSFADVENPPGSEEKLLAGFETHAHGVTVGADGTIYLIDHNLPKVQGQRGVVKLSSDFNSAVELVKDSASPGLLTGGAGRGSQISAAPEAGGLIYAIQEQTPEQGTLEPRVPGSYEIRGMSPVDGSRQIAFGGGSASHCVIASQANAVAAGSGGVVYALDEGGWESSGIGHSSFGFDLVKFGPDGSGCPSPSASFKINGSGGGEKVVVQKGERVVYEAESGGLNGERPTELDWDLDGSGKYATDASGSPPGLREENEYLKPGLYTIGLKILLEGGGNYGNPPPATRQIEVVAAVPIAAFEPSTLSAKPGESVTFDGESSSDPTGLCSTGHGCGPTDHLKEYTWKFGDGQAVTKTWPEDSYSRSFTNSSPQAHEETVTLTVVNEEGLRSAPVTQTLTIQGTPEGAPLPTSGTSPPAPPSPLPAPPSRLLAPVTTPSVTGARPLTKSQKLAQALKACGKIKARKRRATCERQARSRYATKPKKKHKKKE